jgi:hypothetical protein
MNSKLVTKTTLRYFRVIPCSISVGIIFTGCGYYPHNHAAIAIPDGETITFTASVVPETIKKRETKYDDIIKTESLASATWKIPSENLFISPSLFYIGLGSGVGYIFETRTVLAGFAGVSFLPTSLASGISVSQAISNHYFIEYRLNYSKLQYQDCAFGCFESDEGELATYHTLNFATLFGMFYSEFHVEASSFNKEYVTYGLSIGMQIFKKGKVRP